MFDESEVTIFFIYLNETNICSAVIFEKYPDAKLNENYN